MLFIFQIVKTHFQATFFVLIDFFSKKAYFFFMKTQTFFYDDIFIKKHFCDENPCHILIGIHGFGSDCNSKVLNFVANQICKDGVWVVCFDLPAHGMDKNKILTLKKCTEYLKKVTDLFSTYNCPTSFFATSFGGYVLLNFLQTTDHNFQNIILRSPAIFMDQVLENCILPDHGFCIKDLQNKPIELGYTKKICINYQFLQDLKSQKILSINKKQNYFVIQGKKDNVVDFKKNEVFLKKHCKNCKFFYFDNSGHRFDKSEELNQIVDIVKNIILDTK